MFHQPWSNIDRLPCSQWKELQNEHLHHFITRYVYPFSSFYRQRWDKNGIHPDNIRTVEDLKHLPLTDKSDLVGEKDHHRQFILQPTKELIRQHWPLSQKMPLIKKQLLAGEERLKYELDQEFRPVMVTFTTGTTQTPVPFFYTNHDLERLRISGHRMMKLFAADHTRTQVNLFPYAPHLAFWQVALGAMETNSLCLNTGGGKVLGTAGNINAIQKFQPELILGVPGYVYHLLRRAHQQKMSMPFLRTIVLGASRVTPGLKLKIKDLLQELGADDVAVLGTYGFTEARAAWGECWTSVDVSSGYHLYPDREVFEVINPDTLQPVAEGEDGELVYTGIDGRGSVMIRYRTGDFVRGGITYQPCPHCGRTVPRISSDITRRSMVKDLNLSKVKGTLINFNLFDELLSNQPDIEEWQIEITKKDNDPYEVDELHVYVSLIPGQSGAGIVERIKGQIFKVMEVNPNEVQVIPSEEMMKRIEVETANKEKRILDHRPTDKS